MFQEDTTPPPPPKPGFSKSAGIVLALVLAGLAVGGYFWVNQLNQNLHQQIADLQTTAKSQAATIQVLQDRLHLSSSELARLSSSASDVQRAVAQTQQRLSATQQQAQALAQQQQQAASEIASVKQDTGAKLGAINGQITGVKGDVTTNRKTIAQTQAELAATKADLKRTIGDLGLQSGLIATNRKELTALERAGTHAYFPFKLNRHAKYGTKVGSMYLAVTHIDLKHHRYNLDVWVDDAKIEKKNKSIDEPVQFLVGSRHLLNEIVVYQMDKDNVTGYLTAPKYLPTSGGTK